MIMTMLLFASVLVVSHSSNNSYEIRAETLIESTQDGSVNIFDDTEEPIPDVLTVKFTQNADSDGNYTNTYNSYVQFIPNEHFKLYLNDQEIETIDNEKLNITYYRAQDDGTFTSSTSPINAGKYKVNFMYDGDSCQVFYIMQKAVPRINYGGSGIQWIIEDELCNVDYHLFYGFATSRLGGVVSTDYFNTEDLKITYDLLSLSPDEYGYDEYGNTNKIKPEINSDTETYGAIFEFEGNVNYEPIKKEIKYSVQPTYVTAMASDATVRYTGSPITQSISYYTYNSPNSPLNNFYVTAADATFTIFYQKDQESGEITYPVDVGIYYIRRITSNTKNYIYNVATSYPTKTVQITRQTVTIAVTDLNIRQGEEPVFNYTYSGFVNNETYTVLDLSELRINDMPDINVPGKYIIKPTGAKATNYQFGYKSGNLTIYMIHLSSLVENSNKQQIEFNGVFQPGTTISASAYAKDSTEGKRAANSLKQADFVFFKGDVDAIYQFAYISGNVVTTKPCTISINGVKTSSIFSYKVAIIDSNGNVINVSNYALNNGVLTFNTFSSGYVVLYRDSLTTYVVIAIIGLAILAVISLKIGSITTYRATKEDIAHKKQKQIKKKERENVNSKYKW
jgi:hypothetical protein